MSNRSKAAEVVELILRRTRVKEEYANEEILKRVLMAKRVAPELELPLGKRRFVHEITLDWWEGIRIVHVCLDEKKATALFLHGGAYIHTLNAGHLLYLDELAHRAGLEIFAPLYPLAPKHTCEETFAFLPDFWEHLLEEHGSALLMGDSAGGGLAVSLCQYLHEEKKKLPQALVLYSPWLDVSLSDPDCEQYQDSDPVLDIQGLRTCGKIWAGKYGMQDARVSPIFGRTDYLPPVLMFCGTKELFYPQISKFSERLVAEGVECTLILGEDLFHDYAMYPVPEGKETIETVRKWMESHSLTE